MIIQEPSHGDQTGELRHSFASPLFHSFTGFLIGSVPTVRCPTVFQITLDPKIPPNRVATQSFRSTKPFFFDVCGSPYGEIRRRNARSRSSSKEMWRGF